MILSFTQKVVVAPDTLINVIEGESVLLNLKNESYYGLDEVGTRMWEVLTATDNVQSAFDQLLDEYDVEAETLKQDIQEFIGNLMEHGLVELSSE